jgi:hypothetical protein
MRKANRICSLLTIECRLGLLGKKVLFAFQLTRKNMEEKSVAKILGSTPLEMDCWRTSRRKPGNNRSRGVEKQKIIAGWQCCGLFLTVLVPTFDKLRFRFRLNI